MAHVVVHVEGGTDEAAFATAAVTDGAKNAISIMEHDIVTEDTIPEHSSGARVAETKK